MEFDDQAKETWVDSTHKPDVKSSDWGVAIAASPTASTSGGALIVIGAGEGTYSQLNYSTEGSSSLGTNSFRLADAGLATLDPQPILIADPTSSKVAVISTSGGNQSAAIFADATNIQIFGPQSVAAATWLATANGEQIIAGAGATTYAAGGEQHSCPLTAATGTVDIRAMAAHGNGATDDVLVWNGDGQILLYPGAVLAGCPDASPTAATLAGTTGYNPGRGSRILPIDGTRYLLEGHRDNDDASFLGILDATTLTVQSGTISEPKQRAGAVMKIGATYFAFAGYPTATIDGTIAGQVIGYEISEDGSGLKAGGAITLHDAQPDDGQTFGRALAVMPFNGKTVLAVSADNEIFAYFHTNLYDETRTGR